jgi:peroxiredoxin
MILQRFLLLFSMILLLSGFSIPEKENIAVYIFLGEECVISQHYTLQLKELYAQFANEHLTFKGYFPNPNSTPESIQNFKEKYTLPFDLKLDKAQLQMMKFGVTVTPEEVIVKPATQEILYQGRIDNTYFKVGKRRRVTTTFELKNALESIQRRERIAVQKTEIIGCFITPLDPNFKGIPMCQPGG